MNLLNFFQILDVWTPSPVKELLFLLEGLLIYASPIIIIIVIVIIVKKRKKKKITNQIENQNPQSGNINDGNI